MTKQEYLQKVAKLLIYKHINTDELSEDSSRYLKEDLECMYTHVLEVMKQGLQSSYAVYANREVLTDVARELLFSQKDTIYKDSVTYEKFPNGETMISASERWSVMEPWEFCKLMKMIKNHIPVTYKNVYGR